MERPSPSEMEILKVLWAKAPLSARELQVTIQQSQTWSRSTIRTLLTRMVEKGHVVQDDGHGLALFKPGVSKARVMTAMLRSFSAQVFDLDTPIPITAFADSPLLDEADLEEIEALLNSKDEEVSS